MWLLHRRESSPDHLVIWRLESAGSRSRVCKDMDTIDLKRDTEAKRWEAEADQLFSQREFDLATKKYLEVADLYECPPAALCTKLARALIDSGLDAEAFEWSIKVVDAGNNFKDWSAAARVLQRCKPDAIPTLRRKLHVGIVGTWTTSMFVQLFQLAAARVGLFTTVYETGFGQYFIETLDPSSPLFSENLDAVILCPDDRALALPWFSETPDETVDEQLNQWAATWDQLRGVSPLTLIQQGFVLPGTDVFGHYASGIRGSRKHVAAEINCRLADRARDKGVGFVDADVLAARMGKDRWFDNRNWYFAKIPYSMEAMPILAHRTAAVLASQLGFSRRCLVVDLDNTLWGGVVADVEVEGLMLGNGAEGEAYVDFQAAIKDLVDRGVVLAVCSKNEVETAKRPFQTHPEMVLKLEDIAAFVANWEPKSSNLIEISETLNLGLDTFTFLDDNPYERAEVRRSLPMVDVPVLPSEPTQYRRLLEEYPYFELSSFTHEDRSRTEQYRARAQAEELRRTTGSLDAYQASLGMVATIGAIDSLNMQRVVQLINKTNQFNLTTRRRDQAEVEWLLERPNVEHFWVRLRDKFADHGLIAVVIALNKGQRLEIDTMLMSCRVIGRGVEQVIVRELIAIARRCGCQDLVGLYIRSARNELVSDLFERLGFNALERGGTGQSSWYLPASTAFEGCPFIAVERYAAPENG